MDEPGIKDSEISVLKDARIILLSKAAFAGHRGKVNYKKWLHDLDDQLAKAIEFISDGEDPDAP